MQDEGTQDRDIQEPQGGEDFAEEPAGAEGYGPEPDTEDDFAFDSTGAGESTQEPSPEGGQDTRRILIIAAAGLILALVVFGVLTLFLSSQAEPEPTLAPTLEIPPTGTIAPSPLEPTPPPTDATWERIESTGRMIVGTSADYPPFEYYTSDFVLDGFDMALIREIGQRLGVEVMIKDMAFDGLGGALQVGQIDLAVAALSITPERSQLAGFSNIYFVTEDAVLSTDRVQVAVNGPQDLRGSRIGVQHVSVYQEWAESELVATGLVDREDVHLYSEMDKAISDLDKGFIDFVILDLPPAESAVNAGGFAIAGQGLNRQRFGIAIPKGAFVLEARLNQTLGAMQAAGRIEELAKEYLDLDKEDLIPVPTPDPSQPTPTPAPPVATPGCVDGMQWVAHLTYDDNDMKNPPQMQPGQPFVKSWRVRNSGSCTWDTSYALVYITGNNPAARMGGKPAAVDRLVRPGETYDFNVDLVAPLIPGVYQAFWTMRNGEGELFGDKLPVGIEIVSPATATPAPTQTPSPSIQFTVDRTQITQGECVTFAWNVQNVQAVYFFTEGEDWRKNGVAGTGSQTECPSSTTTFNLRVVFTDGTVETRNITVYVAPAPAEAPAIKQFSVYPENIGGGQCVQIAWDVQGQVSNVKITRGGTVLWEPAPVRGSIDDCPPGSGTVGYSLEATGPGGASRSQRNITVIAPTPTPTVAPNTPTPVPPTPTQTPSAPTPAPPWISAFSVAPDQVPTGQCVRVSYRVDGKVDLVQILKNGVIVLDNGPMEASGQDCQLLQAGTVTYRLEASNNAGQKVTQDESIVIVAAPQPTATPVPPEATATGAPPAATDTPAPPPTGTPPPTEPSATPDPTATTGPSDPLLGTFWQVTGYFDGTGLVPVLDGTTLRAVFEDIGVGGSAGCNMYTGPYRVSGANLSIGPLTATQTVCSEPEGIMQQEEAFFGAMESASTFAIVGVELAVSDASGTTVVTAIKRER
jgi:polar amino acid transport system substrate-binding protein